MSWVTKIKNGWYIISRFFNLELLRKIINFIEMELEEVKKRIKLLGLKKSYVAERIGTSAVQFSYYLNNKRELSLECEMNLKRLLNM